MSSDADRAIAIVGVGAVLPDAPSAPAFWQNICNKVYSIREVPPERWSKEDYFDSDPSVPYKTYTALGGWVRDFDFDWKSFRIPPTVAASMDEGQKWAVTIAAEALADYGYPQRPLNTERTGVILGTAMGGEMHYETTLALSTPEYQHALESVPEFQTLPASQREAIVGAWRQSVHDRFPPITEDTMPGELPNIVSGRVANVFNLRGPSFIADAACASSFAAISSAFEMLTEHHVDAVISGGVDRNMGAGIFIKFCKIGALSATGSRPFGAGADGFIMGEGCGAFLLKRLSDAERDGDRIYAVIRGVGGSSDGKGKGITAPNPDGQILSLQRAWENAGLDPATATLVEAHGTSTRVGDVVEATTLSAVFKNAQRGSIALGSAKSNIGHLKAGAGAAGLLKAALAIYHKKLPPTLNAERSNPNFDFANSPFTLNTELRDWAQPDKFPRRAGVSAYGFGGTNFHLVLEEHVPGMLTSSQRTVHAGVDVGNGGGAPGSSMQSSLSTPAQPKASNKPPLRGILAIGAGTPSALKDKLDDAFRQIEAGWTPPVAVPDAAALNATERLFIDFGDHDELLDKVSRARKAAGFGNPQAWKALQGQGIFRGSGPKPGKIGFLFPGQGSQYINMGRELAAVEPVVKQVFDDADKVMTPILGRPLTDFIFVDSSDKAAMKQAELGLMQTAITQPAMLTMNTAIYKLLAEYGFGPDMVMGHSLGEYGALIAADIMPFAHALEASAARGAEMTKVSMEDNGWMAAVMAPYDVIMQTIDSVDGYVVAANINSYSQCVIGGASDAVETAIDLFNKNGYRAMRIPVSHAFHTKIVAPSAVPLRIVLDRLSVSSPKLPLIANVTGELYPITPEEIKDILGLQIASPVQWVKGLETMYDQGVRTFVEVGPKRALKGFVDDVLGEREGLWSLLTNHPKQGELPTFNQALCGLYAAGYGARSEERRATSGIAHAAPAAQAVVISQVKESTPMPQPAATDGSAVSSDALIQVLQQLMAAPPSASRASQPFNRNDQPLGSVVVTGTGLGLPGADKPIMDPENAMRILRGEQFVDLIPERHRKAMAGKRITRLVKGEDGSGSFEVIDSTSDVIKLAGRGGSFDLAEEYGVPPKLIEALDITTQLAMAAGLDALREAGIPLLQTYRMTTKGTYLPEKWRLPESLRDETGVVFASAFPGADRMADEFRRYHEWDNLNQQLATLEDLRQYANDSDTLRELQRRIGDLKEQIDANPYEFDRRFIFRILAMGHSQFAEHIGARGPNTHVNAACASTAQGVAVAEDWIRSGRCRRVIVIGADDVTNDNLMGWIGAGFLSTGAAATDDKVDEAALPFDRRRHGTLLGMGACALVIESEDAVRERGMRGIAEVLNTETANSAFHGTRLDVEHIAGVMERLVGGAERRFGLNRYSMAPQTVFVSHETYTPARGGSAAAEVTALRTIFGDAANEVIVCNTKGFTGHPMGAGVEDVIAVKILEYGIVPPVPNYKEVDPELGTLNLSRGGRYPAQYALHLAAGFGSQISMTLIRRIPGDHDRFDNGTAYRRWLDDVSGLDNTELEVVKRVLRIKAQGSPGRTPIASAWRYGAGPVVRASAPGTSVAEFQPAPMVVPTQAPARPPVSISPSPTAPRVESAPVQAAPAQPAPVQPTPEPVKPTPVESAPLPSAAPATQPATQVAPATPAPAPLVADVVKAAANPVVSKVLAVVADKTGYPEDMLDLDLDLEADLGIDTVKQAETFAAVRETFDIPVQDDLSLRNYSTLQSVIDYVYQNRPELKGEGSEGQGARGEVKSAPATPQPYDPTTPQPDTTAGADMVTTKVLAIVADKTGYPGDMLELDLDMEADLGIDTVKQAETFTSIREAFDIPLQESLSLRDYPTLEKVIGFVYEMRPELRGEVGEGREAEGEVKSAPAPAAPRSTPLVDVVTTKVLAIVADKTGYPEDMLELDLDMEADLGIDTVKQAETFASVREAFDIPLQESLSLRDYPTLESVIEFVRSMRPDLGSEGREAGGEVKSAPAPSAPRPTPLADLVTTKVLAIVADKTGYPEDMLELDLDMEADLGIDTVKQAETFASVREAFDIPLQENLSLHDYPTLESVIEFVRSMRPDLGSEGREAGGEVKSAPAPSAPRPTPLADIVTTKVLAIVADKTGYPEDMLELDLDMEADLGIDTVKQAETFASVREAFDIPLQENLSLHDYPTLESVIEFVRSMRPDLGSEGREAGGEVKSAPAPSAPRPTPLADLVTTKVLAIVADKTGYPEDMLELDLDMEADLGIDTVKQAETFASVREAFDIPLQESLSLRDYPTLESVIEFVRSMRPDLGSEGREAGGEVKSAPAPSAPRSTPLADIVTTKVLAIVADKTGYPEDMLELDLDMEADLGIDTVKQAETFASVREAFDIPLQENLSLHDYPTLESVIEFVRSMRPDLGSEGREAGGEVKSAPAPSAPRPTPLAPPASIGTLEDADRMPRRVPVPQLRPSLDLCKPTGVALDEGSRVVVMLDRGGVGKSLAGRLEKRGVTMLPVEPGIDTDMLKEQLATWLAEGSIQGVYWLAALDVEPAIEAMNLDEWRELNRARVKNLYTTMRALYDAVYPAGTFLISATRFGGQHGYGEIGASAPLGGAVSGFTKAYNVETGMRDEAGALIKAVDFEVSRKTAEPADLLIAETLFDPGIVEVGYHDGQRFGITLVEKPATDGLPGMDLNEETVFVVTGAAGGITSAIVTDLAIASKGIFYLLDLVDVPDRNDADILLYRSDVEALKRKLIEEARERDERPTPVVIEKQIAAIERNEAALRAIESVEQAGGTAHYFSVNLMNGDAVAAVVDEIRQAQGRIDVLLHAGGLLIDRTLPNKEPNQFNLVFDVKADGFFSLIKAAAGMPIGATVSFSSVAGRFGNNGQSDYSSANDLLCKISSSMREWRPQTRGIAIDWTAWGEIGMASRGSVPQIMEALGIDMLPPECGVPTIRRELTYGATRGEIVVAGRLGAWMAEKDETGGLDTDKVNAMLAEREHPLVMVGEVKAAKLYGGLVIETTLDPAEQPFLYDHQVEPDVAWLPGVMGTESMVEAATLLAPDYHVAAVENQRNLGAFKFHRGKPQTMRVTVNIVAGEGGDLLAETLLQSIFQPANVELASQIKDHFAATVRLTPDALERPTVEFTPPATETLDIGAEEIYELFFHGPAYQVIERAKVEDGRVVSLMVDGLLPNAADAAAAELIAPRVIEHMVQAVALWSTKTNGAMALPAGFEAVSVHRQPSEANGQRLYALTEALDGGERFDVTMVDESGNVYVMLKGFRTVQLPS